MDRDGWLKAMNELFNICGAYPVKNKILFFDGNNNHFDYRSLTQIQKKHPALHTFKTSDYINDHPNYNGPNSKLKSLHKVLKSK